MKKILSNKKILVYMFLYIFVVLINTFLCYLLGNYAKENTIKTLLLVLFIILLTFLNVFLFFLLNKRIENKNFLFSLVVFSIIVSSIVFTFIFKLISVIDSNSILGKTSFNTIITLIAYYLVLIGVSCLPLFQKSNNKIVQKKDI